MAFSYLTPYRRRSPASTRGEAGTGFGTGFGGGLFDLHREMNRLFADLFDQEGEGGPLGRGSIAAPAMDIHQDEQKVEITAELPGVKEEDIDLTVEDGVLTLRGEKKSTREDSERGYRERSYGSFERRITLPANIDENACSAEFRDGVLTITLPKTEERKSGRKIPLGQRQAGASSGGSSPGTQTIEHGASGGPSSSTDEDDGAGTMGGC